MEDKKPTFSVAGIALDVHEPWRWHVCEDFDSSEEAMECIKNNKDHLGLLCAWITINQGNDKNIIFHQSYVDVVGRRDRNIDDTRCNTSL